MTFIYIIWKHLFGVKCIKIIIKTCSFYIKFFTAVVAWTVLVFVYLPKFDYINIFLFVIFNSISIWYHVILISFQGWICVFMVFSSIWKWVCNCSCCNRIVIKRLFIYSHQLLRIWRTYIIGLSFLLIQPNIMMFQFQSSFFLTFTLWFSLYLL